MAGCGFAPAYAPGGNAARLQGQVSFDAPTTSQGFALTRQLTNRLGPAAAARYRLSYQVTTELKGLGVAQDNAILRYSLEGAASYSLHDAASDAVLLTGRAASFTSYSASNSTVATVTAERDAEERLMVILADQIVTRLWAAAGSLPQ